MSAHASLGLATLVLCGGFAAPLLFPRWPAWCRASWRVLTLLALTYLVQRVVGSPLRPEFPADGAWERAWQQSVEVGWWASAARGAAGVARVVAYMQGRSRETQIVSDLVGAVIYVATALAVTDVVFAVPVGSLIATSGVIAVVIGLALQSTLSDVFSGIAIDIERPYRAGDVLSVEGGVEGRVREVNWRSTLVATANGDVAVVPNSVMAKARLVNHSLPSPVRKVTVEVILDPRVMPDRCKAALDAALKACWLPLSDPEPTVAQTALRGDGARYEVAFSVADADAVGPARTEVLGQMQRHLVHAAIPLAVDGLAQVPVLEIPSPGDLLVRSDLFGAFAEPERDLLAAAMEVLHLSTGDALFRQGDAADALYLLASGTVGIYRREADGTEVTHRVSPGMRLGALGLVTASPYAATARALTTARLMRLDRIATAAFLDRPALAGDLERLARRGESSSSPDVGAAHGQGGDTSPSRMRDLLRRLAAGLEERHLG